MRNLFPLVRLLTLCSLLLLTSNAFAQLIANLDEGQPTDFFVLCYHDIQDDMRNADPDVLTISTGELINQFSWLREHGYSVISLDDVFAARAGKRPLPAKAVLLTFDDGYKSTHDRVLPLLKLFNYHAVVALVGDWMDAPAKTTINYGNKPVSRDRFLDWSHARNLVDSGLVELASHSYALHHGVLANPQGNLLPAASARVYDSSTSLYENSVQYTDRLISDLRASSNTIFKNTGVRPRTIVWPYGAYNQLTVEKAKSLGMSVSMSLDDGPNRISSLDQVRRNLIDNNSSLEDILPALHNKEARRPQRVVHIDLDYVYDADPVQQERNLGLLIERIFELKVSTVYLQAFSDPDGDGTADALYFRNRHLPMRSDLFGHAAWQLRTRAGVQVYAWMPVLAYHFPASHPLADAVVKSVEVQPAGTVRQTYRRLSPFDPEVVRVIGEIYEDLAIHTDFAGLLFHDDAVLTDFEDASEYALRYYHKQWGLPDDIGKIRADHELAERWARAKTNYLIDLTQQLATKVRRYRPSIKTARNIYARVVLQPESEQWFAQSYPEFLRAYDYTAIMAMPGLDNIPEVQADAWLKQLSGKVMATAGAAEKTVFELQAKNWSSGKYIDASILGEQMRTINSSGIFNFGYYPDDFLGNKPDLDGLRPFISLDTFPYKRERP